MKKQFYLLIVLLSIPNLLLAQIGVGTTSPEESSILDVSSSSKGFLLPRVSEHTAVVDPAIGLMVYDLTDHCVNLFLGNDTWRNLCDPNGGNAPFSIECGSNAPSFNGPTLVENLAVTGTSTYIRVHYTGGDGASYPSESINSTGVTGLTATVQSGTLNNGSGFVDFIVTGTPTSVGSATFPISFLGVNNSSCSSLSETVTASPADLPANIELTAGQKAYIASVYDEDYIPYTTPTSLATTGTDNAGGGNEVLINIQGELNTTSGIKVIIPYTVSTAPVNLPAFSQTRTVISDHVQGSNANSTIGGGAAVTVEFSYQAQTLDVGSGFIEATIKAVGTTLNAVKLDINKGIGTDIGLLLAQFTIATNSSGGVGNIQLKDIAGIPDKRFGELTSTADITNNLVRMVVSGSKEDYARYGNYFHNSLYLPVEAADGSIWLNNNLGANYANIKNTEFNIAKQAQGWRDEQAAGYAYQWGRRPDGHEIFVWNPNSHWSIVRKVFQNLPPFPRNEVTTTDGTLRRNIHPDNQIYTWWEYEPSNVVPSNLWTSASSPNNPCPNGFRVPTMAEINSMCAAEGLNTFTESDLINNALKFPAWTGSIEANGGGSHIEDLNNSIPYLFISSSEHLEPGTGPNPNSIYQQGVKISGIVPSGPERHNSIRMVSSSNPMRCIQD